MRQLKAVVFFLFVSTAAWAQQSNLLFKANNWLAINPADSQRLSLSIRVMPFFKNNEYFSKIQVGQTYFGYQFMPELVWQPHPKAQLRAGAYVRKDYGNSSMEILPLFSLIVKPNERNRFIAGNLQSSLSHNFIEPIYDFERILYDRLENGLQHIYYGQFYEHDLYIDWERMIYRNSPYQEQLTVGYSGNIVLKRSDFKNISSEDGKIYHVSRPFFFNIPVQLMVNHTGGQIDTTPNGRIHTIVNASAGIEAGFGWPESKRFIQGVSIKPYYVFYKTLENLPIPFKQGSGLYLNATVYTRLNASLMLSYWDANGFVSGRGGPLYQSVSQEPTGYTEKHRQLLFLRFTYEKPFYKNFYCAFRVEPYYDFNEKLFEYSYGIYLSYRGDFKLATIKN